MRPAKPDPVRLGDGHCCQCTADHGGACGHIEPILLCHQHLAVRGMRDPFIPWWTPHDEEPVRPHDVAWDTLVP